MRSQKAPETEISVIEVDRGIIDFCIVGTTPLIINRVSEKAKRELLLPKGRKNAAEKASSIKHDPITEYRNSPYTSKDPKSPTLLLLPSLSFKGAICAAALRMPGTNKTEIGQLTYVEGEYVPVWGAPKLFMSIVRSADINKTPDVRTRLIVPKWASKVSVSYIKPILREQPIVNLLSGAGMFIGVGDYRSEKGKGNYGAFRICTMDDPEFRQILKIGRADQVKALADPRCYDDETEELLSWFNAETKLRGLKVAA
jgi:hypothetical protein